MFNSIKDISVGKLDDIIVLIKSINKLPTRAGTPYQKIVVRDMEGAEATFVKFDILEFPQFCPQNCQMAMRIINNFQK